MGKGFYLLNANWWSFLWRYWRGRTPWDTGITPPEVLDFLSTAAPGRALDLGCGTGTNAITLAINGWQVTGIDFAAQAIRNARRKAVKANLHIDFRLGDVTDLEDITVFFDLALDIGCLHALNEERLTDYAQGLQRLVRPGGTYMLYAWLPRTWKGRQRGISSEAIYALLRNHFHEQKSTFGEEGGAPSAWYWFIRK